MTDLEPISKEYKEKHMHDKGIKNFDQFKPQLPVPGEKTTIIFILPPFDMHVQLLEYEGEPIEGFKIEK